MNTAEQYYGLPDGTYTCKAWDALGNPGIYEETETNPETIAKVKSGERVGIVPIYNNHGGYVDVMSLIYKELKAGKMFGYYSMKVAHVLASLGDNPETIIAHPQALIQCKKYLETLGFDTSNLLRNMQNIPQIEGNTILRIQANNKVGALAELLEKLAEMGLNLDYINSVPTGNDNYVFDISLKITYRQLYILKSNLQNLNLPIFL